MSAREKVVMIVPTLSMGGAERQAIELANTIDPERYEVILFTFGHQLELRRFVRDERVRVVNVPRRFKLDIRPILSLAMLIRRERVRVVHCTLQVSLLFARLAIIVSGRRASVIDALHTTVARSRKWELMDRYLYVPLMRGCDRVITVCDAQRAYWLAKYPFLASSMVTVHNGIDPETFRDDVPPPDKAAARAHLGIPPGAPVVGMVAAIRPEKNHAGVIEAASRIVREIPDAIFLFVGGSLTGMEGLEAALRRRVDELGLGRNVRWAGKIAEPKRIVSIFDVALLFSTTTETFPLSLLECLAMGKPVVSSAIGGISEMLEQDVNGRMVPVGDVDALVAALTDLLRDPARRSAMAANARASVQSRFSTSAMARGTEAVFAAALREADRC